MLHPSGQFCSHDRVCVEQGFTLIEVLMALTIFALIAALSYGALGTAGEGFRTLSEVRDKLALSGWTGRQLRSDSAYLAMSHPPFQQQQATALVQPQTPPLAIINDDRGDVSFDELHLLVRESGQAGISDVHYFIDEEKGHLIRESRLLWARDSTEPLSWDMGKAASFSVEAMRQDGRWQQEWRSQFPFIWPRALRVRIRYPDRTDMREWVLPLPYGVDL